MILSVASLISDLVGSQEKDNGEGEVYMLLFFFNRKLLMVILGGPIKHPYQSRNKRATDSLLINVIFERDF